MGAKPQLLKASIAVENSTMTMKADFGENQPAQQTSKALEGLLRHWGEFTESEFVYFAGAKDGKRYMLSLVSDPGRWKAADYPTIELSRLQETEQLDGFEVTKGADNLGEAGKQRLAEALKQFVAEERGISAGTVSVKDESGKLTIVFQNET